MLRYWGKVRGDPPGFSLELSTVERRRSRSLQIGFSPADCDGKGSLVVRMWIWQLTVLVSRKPRS